GPADVDGEVLLDRGISGDAAPAAGGRHGRGRLEQQGVGGLAVVPFAEVAAAAGVDRLEFRPGDPIGIGIGCDRGEEVEQAGEVADAAAGVAHDRRADRAGSGEADRPDLHRGAVGRALDADRVVGVDVRQHLAAAAAGVGGELRAAADDGPQLPGDVDEVDDAVAAVVVEVDGDDARGERDHVPGPQHPDAAVGNQFNVGGGRGVDELVVAPDRAAE